VDYKRTRLAIWRHKAITHPHLLGAFTQVESLAPHVPHACRSRAGYYGLLLLLLLHLPHARPQQRTRKVKIRTFGSTQEDVCQTRNLRSRAREK
jgi:hypothetical protein